MSGFRNDCFLLSEIIQKVLNETYSWFGAVSFRVCWLLEWSLSLFLQHFPYQQNLACTPSLWLGFHAQLATSLSMVSPFQRLFVDTIMLHIHLKLCFKSSIAYIFSSVFCSRFGCRLSHVNVWCDQWLSAWGPARCEDRRLFSGSDPLSPSPPAKHITPTVRTITYHYSCSKNSVSSNTHCIFALSMVVMSQIVTTQILISGQNSCVITDDILTYESAQPLTDIGKQKTQCS